MSVFPFRDGSRALIDLGPFLAEPQIEGRQFEPELPCFPFKFGAGRQQAFPREYLGVFLDPLPIDFSSRYDSLGFLSSLGDDSDCSTTRSAPQHPNRRQPTKSEQQQTHRCYQ
jgi:hypothetical protein